MSVELTSILLVESNPDNIHLIQETFNRPEFAEFKLSHVSTLKNALGSIKNNFSKVILLDLSLPDATGPEGLKQIKREFPDTLVIVLTGDSDVSYGPTAVREGAQDYLVKNQLTPELLLRSIRYALARRHTEEDRKRTEQVLETAQRRFRMLFESDIMGIFLTDTQGKIFDANGAFLKLTGYDRDDLQSGLVSWVTMTVPGFEQADQRGLKLLEDTGSCPAYEKEYFRKNGERVAVLVGAMRTSQAEGGELIAFALDISEKKRLEQQFVQSQKLEAIGLLAGGVAHDFNNILGIIFLNVDSLLDQPLSESAKAGISIIKSAAEKAARLTRQLLGYSRKQIFRPTVLSANSIIFEMEKMFSRLLGELIQVRLELASSELLIKADHGQFEQVLMNLIVNAKDAMPMGGQLFIRSAEVSYPANVRLRAGSEIKAGRYVKISISDTGCGMSLTTQQRIFEPFYTTKSEGKGTGLGLATVFGVVQQSHGHIDVESVEGRGSTFHIYFPVATCVAIEAKVGTSIKTKNSGEQKTVLLIEDDPGLRDIVSLMLEKDGLKVHQAENGKLALEIFEKYKHVISAVITDVIMPTMTGPAFVAEARKRAPEKNIKVLFLSGYAADELSLHGVSQEDSYFLEKPFNTAKLLAKVHEILGSQP